MEKIIIAVIGILALLIIFQRIKNLLKTGSCGTCCPDGSCCQCGCEGNTVMILAGNQTEKQPSSLMGGVCDGQKSE